MSRKRPSLAELVKQDEEMSPVVARETVVPVQSREREASPLTVVPSPSAKVAEKPATNDERDLAPEASMVVADPLRKVTVTLPSEMHEILLDMSRKRRRNGRPFHVSELVREAVGNWLSAEPG